MFISINDFIFILKKNKKIAREFAKQNKGSLFFERISLSCLIEIAEVDFYTAKELLKDELLKINIIADLTLKKLFYINKLNSNLAKLLAEDIKSHFLMTSIEPKNFIKLVKHHPNLADAFVFSTKDKFYEMSATIQETIANKATIEELFTIFKLHTPLMQILLNDINILEMIAEKATIQQIMAMIKLNRLNGCVLARNINIQNKLIEEMSSKRYFELTRIDKKAAYILICNETFREKIMRDVYVEAGVESIANNGIERLLELLNENDEKVLAIAANETVQQVFAEQISIEQFFIICAYQPTVMRLMVENMALQNRLITDMLLEDFFILLRDDKEIAHILIKNSSLLEALRKKMLAKNSAHAFVKMARIDVDIAKIFIQEPDVWETVAANIKFAEFIKLAEAADFIADLLTSHFNVQDILSKEMTVDKFIDLLSTSPKAAQVYINNDELKLKFVTTNSSQISIGRLIKIAKLNPYIAKIFLQKRLVNVQVNSSISIKKFIYFATIDPDAARILITTNVKAFVYIEKQLTLDLFVALANIDEKIANCYLSSMKKFFYDPANLILLMKRAPFYATKLIEKNPSFKDILKINGIPADYSTLCNTQISKKTFAEMHNLKKSAEYNPLIILLLGKSLLIDNKKLLNKLPHVSKYSCLELGRLLFCSLHDLPAQPSKYMCKEFALLRDREYLPEFTRGSGCKPRYQFFSPKNLHYSEQNYIDLQDEYEEYFSNYFASMRLKFANGTYYQDGFEQLIVDAICKVLNMIDPDRYAERKIISIENAINELNYQNTQLAGALLQPSDLSVTLTNRFHHS